MAQRAKDRWGVDRQVGDGHFAPSELDDAIEDLVRLQGDPLGRAERSMAADPDLILARVMTAYLRLYGTSRQGLAEATALLGGVGDAGGVGGLNDRVEPSAIPERERRHLQAARAWASGDWTGALRALEGALLLNPRDLLALKVAQDLYFFVGNRLDIRDVVARVRPAWPEGTTGWSYVEGMYAFGLEENADYRGAEAAARAALGVDSGDVWAVHAFAHVFEMENQPTKGEGFLADTAGDWSDSYFAVHNWWHLGLYLLDRQQIDRVVRLYDEQIRAVRSPEWLDMVDAASLLWRLSLFGVDVSGRAAILADDIEGVLDDPIYVFNDWHAAMVFGLAGRHTRNDELLHANQIGTWGTNRIAAERAGLALIAGFAALAAGDPARALDWLIDVRSVAPVVGGSHAQRDVIDLTLLTAAARTGRADLVRALLAERSARRPSATESLRPLLRANGHDPLPDGSPTGSVHGTERQSVTQPVHPADCPTVLTAPPSASTDGG